MRVPNGGGALVEVHGLWVSSTGLYVGYCSLLVADRSPCALPFWESVRFSLLRVLRARLSGASVVHGRKIYSMPAPVSEPASSLRHVGVLDPDELFKSAAPMRAVEPSKYLSKGLSSIHAIHGQHRHVGGRWRSTFAHVEGETGTLRRRLEAIERQGERYQGEPWKVRRKLIDVYNERALLLLRGSGFVEAYHLLQGALELSLYASEGGHLCVAERGIGATPEARGTRLTALTLNNLAVYHRRRGMGRPAFKLLTRAQEIEGDDPSVSTQINMCVLATELGKLRSALAHLRAAVRRITDESSKHDGRSNARTAHATCDPADHAPSHLHSQSEACTSLLSAPPSPPSRRTIWRWSSTAWAPSSCRRPICSTSASGALTRRIASPTST